MIQIIEHFMIDFLPKNILKYCTVGVLGAATDFLVYAFLIHSFNLYYLVSNVISFIFALLLVYYLQKNWTFQYFTINNSKTFSRYLRIVVITYILNNFILIVSIELVGTGLLVSKIIQILISFAWGYYASNSYVFNKELID